MPKMSKNRYQKLAVDRVEKLIALDAHYLESDGNQQVTLRDILTDLRHYVDEYGLDIYKALDGSYQVYLEEKAWD